jgi:hypothetical protein
MIWVVVVMVKGCDGLQDWFEMKVAMVDDYCCRFGIAEK